MSASLITLIDSPVNRLRELKQDAIFLKTRTSISKNENKYVSLLIALIEGYIKKGEGLKAKVEAQGLLSLDILEPVVSSIKSQVAEINNLLKIVQKSHPVDIPLGTEGLVRDLSKRLTENNLDFFLNISHSEEYSTSPELIRNLINKVKEISELPEGFDESVNLVLINFFALQSKDILRHSVFAHEIGHVLIKFDTNFEQAFNKIIELILPSFESAIEQIEQVYGKLSNAHGASLGRIFRSWMEEFFVDLVSIHSLGPAAFLAMKELGTEEAEFYSSESHPVFYKRIVLLWTALDKSGFGQVFTSVMKDKIDHFVSYCSDFANLDLMYSNDSILKILNSVLDKTMLDNIVDTFISSNLPGKYMASEFTSEVPLLTQLFTAGIAACELPDFTNRKFVDVSGASILNAAWIVEDTNSLPLEKLNPILNKALANHYLKIQWENSN